MLVIGIAGGTGSGKTTVARAIVSRIGTEHVAFISQDSYYIDSSHLPIEERSKRNYDHPDSFDSELLISHVRQLKQGKTVEVPTYSFSQHARLKQTVTVPAKAILVIEGILVLADPVLRAEMDIKVFVDTDPDVRVLRRMVRDIRERGRTVESVHEQYLKTVKPMHDAFIEPSKRFADLIIPEGGQNEIAVGLLTSRIEQFVRGFNGRNGAYGTASRD